MGEEIPSSKRRKIEETVLNILKDADLETATESSVRTTASQQLDTDFSDLASKIFIRQVVESFLLSNAPSTTTPDHAGNNNKVSVPEDTKAPSTTTPGDAGNKKVSVPEGTKLGEVGKKDPEFGRHICNVSLTLVLNFIFILKKKSYLYNAILTCFTLWLLIACLLFRDVDKDGTQGLIRILFSEFMNLYRLIC